MAKENIGIDGVMSQNATKIMQERLMGVEKDTKELARMLVDLGISPPREIKNDLAGSNPAATIEQMLADDKDLIKNKKEPQKTVSFGPTVRIPFSSKHNQQAIPSILKKPTVQPLKLQFTEGNLPQNLSNSSGPQYQQMVERMCKNESMIQSLKLSLCALQTNKHLGDREKSSVIEKLKQEIEEKQSEIEMTNEQMKEAVRNRNDAERRWREAEEEVKSLHQQLLDMAEKQHGKILMSDADMKQFRTKSARKIADAKEELMREQSLRKSLEESHNTLLTRVHDVEENVEHERKQVASLRDECAKLKNENQKFRDQGAEWTKRASDMDRILKNLKEELDAKEKAIKVLVNEQNAKEQESSQIASSQSQMKKKIQDLNVVIEAQKATFLKLEKENESLKSQAEDTNAKIQAMDEEAKRAFQKHVQEIEEMDAEYKTKLDSMQKNMKKDVKIEKTNCGKLEDRIRILEDCVKQQEKIIQEKDTENEQNSEELQSRMDEEKQKLRTVIKERDEALRAKEGLAKEISKGKTSYEQDKTCLQQQLCELQLEYDALVEAKRIVDEENGRLMERSSAVQQQEAAYKRMQDTLASTNDAKSKLAYDKGKLQTRVEQLEDEIQVLATVQSQLLQAKSTNHTLEQKYSHAASELATSRVESQRLDAQVKQMSVAMKRKESEFTLAIGARDQALREKEEVVQQMDFMKENESSKMHQLRRSLAECKSDNARMAGTLENVMSRHNELQEALDSLQTQLGRKDSEVMAMSKERQEHIQTIQAMHNDIEKLQTQLSGHKAHEQEKMSPLLTSLEKARTDNLHLSSSLDEVLKTNTQMKEELDKCQAELNSNQRQIQSLKRREDALTTEAETVSTTHAERMKQAKDQFDKERSVLKKQMQSQISEIKKSLESSQTRCTQLSKGNSELRGKLAEKEKSYDKLRERAKVQKTSLERLQRERQLHGQTSEKIKEINSELVELEKAKRIYMEKNRQQSATINTFNAEVSSLKTDIIALGTAQQHAKELNEKLQKQVEKEKSEKRVLLERAKELQADIVQLKKEKQEADERLQKVQRETVHVQQNLNEAQTWFTEKFETLQAELKRSKGAKRHHNLERVGL